MRRNLNFANNEMVLAPFENASELFRHQSWFVKVLVARRQKRGKKHIEMTTGNVVVASLCDYPAKARVYICPVSLMLKEANSVASS